MKRVVGGAERAPKLWLQQTECEDSSSANLMRVIPFFVLHSELLT
jgi:hypothetical protein